MAKKRLLVVLLALLCCLMLLVPAQAFAYYDRGSVGVSVGSSSVSVQAGSSTSVSVTLSPAADQQTQGCGMAECPQTCPPECIDGNGQCVCAGGSYSTYYPSVAVTSSNGGVAQASYSGGAVQIYGGSVGSATITVTASLRQFSSSSATINVQVSAAAGGGGAGTGAGVAGGGGSNPNANNSGQASNAGASSNGVVVSPTELAQAVLDQGATTEDSVIEMHGRTLRLAALTPNTDVVAKLKEIAGTSEQLTLWSGGTVDKPNYSWVFKGEQIDASVLDSLENLDLSITVSAKGSGLVASLLDAANKSLVLDFAHDGVLPAPATIYVATPAGITPDDDLSLYLYSEQQGSFNKVLDGLWSENGYIAFEIDHCSTWAISAENLTALSAGAGAGQGAQAAGGLSTAVIVAIVVAVVVVLALIVVILVSRGRKRDKDSNAPS